MISRAAQAVPARAKSLHLGGLIKAARENLFTDAINPQTGVAQFKGRDFARRLEAITTQGVIGLFEAARFEHPEIGTHMALIAVGGYGRGFLAPYSDLDLLILHTPRAAEKIKPGLNFILYALFDAGLMVSQAVHSPAGAARFIKSDLNGLTSFLDARFLCGHEKLADDFTGRFETVREATKPDFVKAKLAERDVRYQASSMSRYLVEPDVKEGKGGLRDVDLLHWLIKYTAHSANAPVATLMKDALGEDLKIYRRAADFLWSVRVQLHLFHQRADEKLSFQVQPEIASRLGYQARGQSRAVERFMKHYFLNLRHIGQLTGIVSARLEAANVKESRGLLSLLRLTDKSSQTGELVRPHNADRDYDNITLKAGRIAFKDPDKAAQNYRDLFAIFRIYGLNPSYDLHPDSLSAIKRGAVFLDRKRRAEPETAQIFAAFLTASAKLEKPLRMMSETGLLGAYIRAFGRLVGHVEYGLFRRYSLDEHVIKSMALLDRLRQGEEIKTYPVATRILQNTSDPLPFFLLLLLYETGAASGQTDPRKIRQMIERAIARFANSLEDGRYIATIARTAAAPHLMTRTASLRNPLSPALVAHFCEQIEDQQTLDLYLVLSAVHARVAGVDSWDRRAGRDVVVLYEAAKACFQGGKDHLQTNIDTLIQSRQAETARRLKTWRPAEVTAFFDRFPSGFWVGLTPADAAQLCIAARNVDETGDRSASIISEAPGGLYELITYAPDRPGLFADIAGTLSEIGANMHAAFAFPVAPAAADKGQMASNMFIFALGEGIRFADIPDRLETKLAARLTARRRPKITLPRRFGDRRCGFDVPILVRTDLISSGSCTVFDVEGLDRPGLLYALANALAELDMTLKSAYVTTHGEKVTDSFYVQDKTGRKIYDQTVIDTISAALKAAIEIPGDKTTAVG